MEQAPVVQNEISDKYPMGTAHWLHTNGRENRLIAIVVPSYLAGLACSASRTSNGCRDLKNVHSVVKINISIEHDFSSLT